MPFLVQNYYCPLSFIPVFYHFLPDSLPKRNISPLKEIVLLAGESNDKSAAGFPETAEKYAQSPTFPRKKNEVSYTSYTTQRKCLSEFSLSGVGCIGDFGKKCGGVGRWLSEVALWVRLGQPRPGVSHSGAGNCGTLRKFRGEMRKSCRSF